MAKKIIAVAGATGAQGGGLVRAIAADTSGEFAARALTRDANSDKAKALAALGVEVVQANVDDVDSVKAAFDGAYGAYCVTFFWEHFSPEQEFKQASNMAEAAKAAGVKHAIWSTFEDTRDRVPLSDDRMPTLMGNYKVPHFDSKAEADKIFRELGVPTTFLLTSGYWENLIYFGWGPQKGPDGKYYITMPLDDKKMPSIATEDIGKAAYGIFKTPDQNIGKTIGVAGEHLSGAEMAQKLTSALGFDVGFNNVTADQYRAFGFPGAEDIGNMFQYKRDFDTEYRGARSVEGTRALNPELLDFDSWLAKNKDRIPIE